MARCCGNLSIKGHFLYSLSNPGSFLFGITVLYKRWILETNQLWCCFVAILTKWKHVTSQVDLANNPYMWAIFSNPLNLTERNVWISLTVVVWYCNPYFHIAQRFLWEITCWVSTGGNTSFKTLTKDSVVLTVTLGPLSYWKMAFLNRGMIIWPAVAFLVAWPVLKTVRWEAQQQLPGSITFLFTGLKIKCSDSRPITHINCSGHKLFCGSS
jgi:hypothetical protein